MDSKPRSQRQAGENQQVEARDRELRILLKVRPALPGVASDAEDSLQHHDGAFDTGPEASQLPIDSTAAHHLVNHQPVFLGGGDILDALLLGPLQIGVAGKATIEAGVSGPATVNVKLALSAGAALERHRPGSAARSRGPTSSRRLLRMRTRIASDCNWESSGNRIGLSTAMPSVRRLRPRSKLWRAAQRSRSTWICSQGGGLGAADVLRQAGGIRGPAQGQMGEPTKTLGVAQVGRQRSVG